MIGYLGDFSRVCQGSLKDHTEIIKRSNRNQISILKGSHHDLDTITVRLNLGYSYEISFSG